MPNLKDNVSRVDTTGQAPGVKDIADPTPSPVVVNRFHTKSDLDSKPWAQHHSLGPRPNQASPGNHKHDGATSQFLLAGVTISGAKAGNTALASVIAALVKLGATDATT